MNKKGRYTFRGWSTVEYIDYITSVGMVAGIAVISGLLAILALVKHIDIPQIAFAIPIGFIIFSIAWAFDSMAHRSVFKNVIDRGELVIHDFMTFYSAYPLFICFVVAYWLPGLMMPFIFGFAFLKTLYSTIDEVKFHHTRFDRGASDLIEMSAHSFQFLSNCVFDFAWIYWIYYTHYQGAKDLFLHAIALFH